MRLGGRIRSRGHSGAEERGAVGLREGGLICLNKRRRHPLLRVASIICGFCMCELHPANATLLRVDAFSYPWSVPVMHRGSQRLVVWPR